MKVTLRKLQEIGLSREIGPVPHLTDEPKINYFLCEPNEVARVKYNVSNCYGQGFDLNEDLAKVKSIGELLERICLDNLRADKTKTSFFQEDGNHVDPSIFCCLSREQVGNQEKFKQDVRKQEYNWYKSTELISGRSCWIPSQMVSLDRKLAGEFLIRGEMITTGGAFGKKGTNRALESGLLEAIERDSCISSYLQQKEIKRIVNLPQELQALKEYVERYLLEPHIFDVTSDLRVPTVMTVTVDRTGIGPTIEVGSAAAFNYKDAIKKSLLESIQCRRSSRIFPQEELPEEENITSMEKRFRYWHEKERIYDLEFWVKSNKEKDFASLKPKNTNFDKILSHLKRRNFHVFVSNITLPEIEEKGFETLKIVIPELHPLYLDERAKMLYSVHYGNIKNNPQLKPHPLT